MPQARNLTSFEDTRELLQQAIESPKGLAIDCPTPSDAFRLRMRLYATRRAEHRENLRRYPADSPLHGRSHFDSLTIRVSGSTVEIINAAAITFNIRRLR